MPAPRLRGGGIEHLTAARHALAGCRSRQAVGSLNAVHAGIEAQARGVHVPMVLLEQGLDLVEDHHRAQLSALADDVQQPRVLAIHALAPEALQAGRGQL